MALNFNELMLPVPRTAVFKQNGFHVWCGSMVEGEQHRYYLFYSRWPKALGHFAWVTHSEVAYAVSDHPLGPYQYAGIALKGSGGERWDACTVHNPTVLKIGSKYYMYYMGTKGKSVFGGKPSMQDPDWWEYRNNQRVGVAVADHPAGPWYKADKPCIDVTPGSFDHLMTSNPTAAQGPDGRIYMVYKAVGDGPKPKGGAVICGVAVAKHPLGPFVKQAAPIMINPANEWSVEDPYIWVQNDRFYALVKDFQGYFTGRGKATIALFESIDGMHWEASLNPFAFKREICWEDGTVEPVEALERPQLWLDNGVPAVLFCAVAADAERDCSFNVHIPLLRESPSITRS